QKCMKNKLLSLALVIVTSFFVAFAYAQERTITGKITNQQGDPVVATIRANNGGGSTSSNDLGDYSLTIGASSDSLIVTAVGFNSTRVAIRGPIVNISLSRDGQETLDEVVVVGYGTQRKTDLTAPIGIVDMEEAVKRTVSSPMDALQGAVTGVQIVSTGAPGASPIVRIRGVGSFENEAPLYVV